MNQKKLILIENQYFPCINWINCLFQDTDIHISSCERYQKMSFRNRCMVAGSNGVVHLSVPVEHGRNQKVPFKDVRISYRERWQTNHWRTLASCYNKSAFFEFYREGLEKLFLKREEFLFDLDTSILCWLKGALKVDCNIVITGLPAESLEAGCTDLRDNWLPKNFKDGGNKAGMPRPPSLKYFQLFEDRIGFKPNLSILDLLFNMGPAAAQMLKNG